MREVWTRLLGAVRRGRADRDMEEEFRFHVEQATRRNLELGLSPEQARRRALLAFGGMERFREAGRDAQRSRYVEDAAQDLRYAARSLGRSPGFAVAAVLTVALGIGASTAIFSVVDGVLLRPLPFPEPGRLTHLGWTFEGGGGMPVLTAGQFAFVREHATVFDGVATYRTFERELGGVDRFAVARGMVVTADFFRVTGWRPALGRVFDAAEAESGAAAVAVLSDGFWRREFGGDPGVLGREIRLDGVVHTVVGVLSPGLRFPTAPEHTDVLVPLRLVPDPRDEGMNWVVLARYRPDAGRDRAAQDLARVSDAFRAAHPDLLSFQEGGLAPFSFQAAFVGDLRRALMVLFGAVGFVLLVACANAASLLLARATTREREMAVRAAIGAGRGRIVRQLLVEGLLLTLIAGLVGLGIGKVALDGVLALAPTSIPRADEIGLDARVLGFTLLIATVTGIAFGLVAALPGVRTDVVEGLRSGTRGATAGRRRVRGMLVVAETALAVVLLAGAALLIASFAKLRTVDPGFDAAGVLSVRYTRMPQAYADPARRADYERRVLERIGALPGVRSAGLLSNYPLERGVNMPVAVEGRPDAFEGAVELRSYSPGAFDALRLGLVRGRAFTDADDAGSTRVAIINEAMARRYWPDGDALGQRIEIGKWNDRWLAPVFAGAFEVIGIAADAREIDLTAPARRTVYVPRAQLPLDAGAPLLVVRADRPSALPAAILDAVRDIDPLVPPPVVAPLAAVVGASLAPQRFQTVLLSIFAGAALLLTAIGIYGVVAYTVRQQVREIGIRMALGARADQVVRRIVRHGMTLVAVGLVLGLLGAAALTRLLAGVLYDIAATDARAFAAAVAVLAAVGLLAAWLPARRAARVPPTVTLLAD